MGRPGDPRIFWVGYPTQPNLLGWVPKAETPGVTRGLPRPMPNTEILHTLNIRRTSLPAESCFQSQPTFIIIIIIRIPKTQDSMPFISSLLVEQYVNCVTKRGQWSRSWVILWRLWPTTAFGIEEFRIK